MANEYVSKVVLSNGTTLIDLTGDSITQADVINSKSFHDKAGQPLVGSCTYDADTSEDTAAVAEILSGRTAHARGALLTGTMPNRGAVTGTIATKDGVYTIQQGFHNGQGGVRISQTEADKLLPSNIKAGVTILSVLGTYTGEEISLQSKSVSYTPAASAQTASVSADSGYDGLSAVSVTVAAIPYVETANTYGTTVTIG